MLKKIFRSENYLGGRKRNYFEGWYFRHSGEYPFSFIAGVSKNKNDPHSFIQYIDCSQSFYFRFGLEAFSFDKNDMTIIIGGNIFSLKGIRADLRQNGAWISADLIYGDTVRFKKSLFAPSVMGPFSYLPMPCSHVVISLDQGVCGVLNVDGEKKIVDGRGYIEKDFGRTFPKNYLWLHFNGGGVSGVAAVASPIIFGKRGFLCTISHNGVQYNLSLYNCAKIKKIKSHDGSVTLCIKKGDSELTALIEDNSSSCKLLAPDKKGGMTREINENLNAGFSGSLVLNGMEIDLSSVKSCAFECALSKKTELFKS